MSQAEDAVLVGLSFSGGGTRAAAFSYGVLSELERVPVRGAGGADDRSPGLHLGVSGGSVMAAYYGLKKRAALLDFRERFLLRNAEEALRTNVSLVNLGRAFGGGVNDAAGFTRWLDDNLFAGATFGQFRAVGRPRVWINASDIYNRTPFVFGATAFSAMCSDIDKYPLADAVAASAAVPLAFAPIVMQTFPAVQRSAAGVDRARATTATRRRCCVPSRRRSAATTTAQVPFIKLLDGGLVDNYGLSGFTIARQSSETPYGPLNPQAGGEAAPRHVPGGRCQGRLLGGNWISTVEGPRAPIS